MTCTIVANDTLFGTEGNDTLLGLGGDDFLFSSAGDDIVNGGDGNDIVNYNTFFLNGITSITLTSDFTATKNGGGGGTDTLIGIETILGQQTRSCCDYSPPWEDRQRWFWDG
jgi:large repetitive protein